MGFSLWQAIPKQKYACIIWTTEGECVNADDNFLYFMMCWCRFGQMVACFRYASIDVHSVYLPPAKLDFNYKNQEWIGKEIHEVKWTLLYYCSFWVSVYHYMSNALSFTLSIYLTGSWASWAFVLWSAQCSSPSGRKKMWPKYDEQWYENPWIKTRDNRSRRALAERKVNIWGLVSFSDLEVLFTANFVASIVMLLFMIDIYTSVDQKT